MTSGQIVWLTKYIKHRKMYDDSTGRPPLNSLYFEWTETVQEKFWRILKG